MGFNGRCLGARSGDGGFVLARVSGCRGVIGFKAAMSKRPVREKVRPAALFQRESAKKFAQRAKKPQISLHLGLLGEFFCG